MSDPSITHLLVDWSKGDHTALDKLTPHVYRELYEMARSYLRRDRSNHTLQPTALIGELYLRVIDHPPDVTWNGRSHFFAIASRLMRRVLVDHARSRRAAKRGGGSFPVTLDEMAALAPGSGVDILSINDALDRLAGLDKRKAEIMDLRYFGGLSCEEVASVLDVSPATVKRDLRVAEAFLRKELLPSGSKGSCASP
jgi:RNA polymerase sigma factor (TIGR02999 family)